MFNLWPKSSTTTQLNSCFQVTEILACTSAHKLCPISAEHVQLSTELSSNAALEKKYVLNSSTIARFTSPTWHSTCPGRSGNPYCRALYCFCAHVSINFLEL